jgi:hypothetical protein
MKRIATIILATVLFAAAALACEGDRVVALATIAVDRCMHRNVTLGFDRPGHDREFVTISNDDARKLYETLKPIYENEHKR